MEEEKYSIEWYIKERVEDQLEWYSKKATTNKNWYFSLVLADIILSALIPFVTLYYDLFGEAKYIVAGLGTIVTIVSGVLSTFQYQKKWIEYRTTAETIKHEKFLFLSNVSPYDLESRNVIFIKNVESLISQENTNWAFYIQKSNVESEEEE